MASESAVHVGLLTVKIRLHEAGSLKEKRHILHSLLEINRKKFNISFAEVGDSDLWQSAVLAAATAANDGRHVNRVLDSLLDALEANPNIEVGETSLEIL